MSVQVWFAPAHPTDFVGCAGECVGLGMIRSRILSFH